jgi:uncharacterized membrane protein (DUF485 family)
VCIVSHVPQPRPTEGPPLPHEDDDPGLAAANARAGLGLFAVYCVLYGGFMGLNAFAPGLMAWAPGDGLNLALLYGMALIFAAVLLAFVYMAICRRNSGRYRRAAEGRGR